MKIAHPPTHFENVFQISILLHFHYVPNKNEDMLKNN